MIENLQGISPLVVTALDPARNAASDDADANRLQDASGEVPNNEPSVTADISPEAASLNADAFPAGTDFSQISDRLQQLLNNDTTVQFSIDETTKRIVMTVVNVNTQEVVRQIPAEESLRIAKFITESFEQGQVTDAKV